jgi:D-alanyl-D-alanine carboxypeptidase
MLKAAAGEPLIHSITTTASYEFATGRRDHLINNTNRLLKSRYEILGGKTGFINESGYCFATWLRVDGHDLIAVVLGAPTAATRFADVVRLVQRTVASGFQVAKS